jgi:hypothetical protein
MHKFCRKRVWLHFGRFFCLPILRNYESEAGANVAITFLGDIGQFCEKKMAIVLKNWRFSLKKQCCDQFLS